MGRSHQTRGKTKLYILFPFLDEVFFTLRLTRKETALGGSVLLGERAGGIMSASRAAVRWKSHGRGSGGAFLIGCSGCMLAFC